MLVYSLSTKLEVDSCLNIGDLLADRSLWKDTHTQTHTQRLNLIVSDIAYRVE